MELNSFCKAVKEASGKKIAYKALKAFHFQKFPDLFLFKIVRS